MSTIAAISTPYGTGGIGIVRISGSGAFNIAGQIFAGRKPFADIGSHTASHGKIIDPETGRMLDDVLLIKMKGPHTFTGEDVVEINCHGGITVLKNVLSLVLRQGAQAAGPGEFTKRAFLNGRMDLAQAEAVIDLINSKTDESSRAAAAQLEGHLSENIGNERKKLIGLIAHIEAVVDYPEHDIEELTGDRIYEGVCTVREALSKIAQGYEKGRLLREGLSAAIIGKPNAGKSSLLNELAGNSRAIVTDIPGTTRDIIEEYINVRGIPVRFLDTAGLRNTQDPVESIGVERAQKAAREADLVIVVLDAQTGLLNDDIEILKAVEEKKKIVVINKTDIAQDEEIVNMRTQLNKYGDLPVVVASMLDGTGTEELMDEIEGLFLKGKLELNNEILITNARHRQLLDRAIECLDTARDAHEGGLPLDFVTIDIKESADYLGQITGESVSEDVVKEIFSRFCIGK
ncbi:MAG: tRNA uridine-5-carboxymethylaminomethyl(34) synthesis GTPase MnmE [Clostridiaceae bacterium]